MNAAWAILMIFITPKMRVSPETISAYTPPVSNPITATWIITLIDGRFTTSTSPHWGTGTRCRFPSNVSFSYLFPLPLRLRPDRISLAAIAGIRDDEVTTLPLEHHEGALRLAKLVEAERTHDRLEGALVELSDQRGVVNRTDVLHCLPEHLTDREGVGGILGNVGCRASEHLHVLGDELGVLETGGFWEPRDGCEYAFGRTAKRLPERPRQRRPGREEG